jgi:hypothetical protein
MPDSSLSPSEVGYIAAQLAEAIQAVLKTPETVLVPHLEACSKLWGLVYNIRRSVEDRHAPPALVAILDTLEEQSDSYGKAGGGWQVVLPRVAEALNEFIPHNAGEWSTPQSPTEWARVFKVNPRTFSRWFTRERPPIRMKKLTSKSYQVHIDDLPKLKRS